MGSLTWLCCVQTSEHWHLGRTGTHAATYALMMATTTSCICL